MAQVLQLKFKTELGTQFSLTVDRFKQNLTKDEITKYMNDICALNLFKDDDGKVLAKTPYSAKIVETKETDLYGATVE